MSNHRTGPVPVIRRPASHSETNPASVESVVQSALALAIQEMTTAIASAIASAVAPPETTAPATRRQGQGALVALAIGAVLLGLMYYQGRVRDDELAEYQARAAEAKAAEVKAKEEADDRRHRELLDVVGGLRTDVDALMDYHRRDARKDPTPDVTSGVSPRWPTKRRTP